MHFAVTPRSASGRWSLLFAGLTVLATLAAWIVLLPVTADPSGTWVRMALGQACIAPAAAATALGLASLIHYGERSVLTWATTLAALAVTVATAAIMLSTSAQPY
jgi:hypothetical protein